MNFIAWDRLFCLMFRYANTRCAVARSFSFGKPTSGGASACHPGAIQSAGLRHLDSSSPAGLSGRLGHPTLLALRLPEGFLPHRFHVTEFGGPSAPGRSPTGMAKVPNCIRYRNRSVPCTAGPARQPVSPAHKEHVCADSEGFAAGVQSTCIRFTRALADAGGTIPDT